MSSDATGPGIYLAGPVEHDASPRSWRDELRDRYPAVNWIDPMDWQDEWEADPAHVWDRELKTCRTGAILVCNIGTNAPRTTGTHHEIREALNHGQPVAIVPNGKLSQIYREIEDVSVFDDVDEAIQSLTESTGVTVDAAYRLETEQTPIGRSENATDPLEIGDDVYLWGCMECGNAMWCGVTHVPTECGACGNKDEFRSLKRGKQQNGGDS